MTLNVQAREPRLQAWALLSMRKLTETVAIFGRGEYPLQIELHKQRPAA